MTKSESQIKQEYNIVMRWAIFSTFMLFLFLTPRLVLAFTDRDLLFGLGETETLMLSLPGVGFYIWFYVKKWKCPACLKFPGGGWFRKECKNCNVPLG